MEREEFTGVRCKLCGDLLLVGRFGMLCGRGHGGYVYRHYSKHAKLHPELVIEHQSFATQKKALRGAAFFQTPERTPDGRTDQKPTAF